MPRVGLNFSWCTDFYVYFPTNDDDEGQTVLDKVVNYIYFGGRRWGKNLPPTDYVYSGSVASVESRENRD